MKADLLYGRFPVFCLKYSGLPERFDRIDRELAALGVSRKFDIINSKCPLTKYLYKTLRHEIYFNEAALDLALGHLRMICSAYQLGYDEAVFCEDDVGFLRDSRLAQSIVDDLPADYLVAQFDYAPWDLLNIEQKSDEEVREIFGSWLSKTAQVSDGGGGWLSVKSCRFTGCYALSRRGMEAFVKCYERVFERGKKARHSDHFFNEAFIGERVLVPKTHLAVQLETSDGCNSGYRLMRICYGGLGVDISQYGHT